MKVLITNDIEAECLNMISVYLDTNYIKDKILLSYPNLSTSKQGSVSERIRFYINQGLELYSVSNTSINTIPLTLFYSLNNFVKAAYLLRFPNLSISGSHGIELKTIEIESATNIGEIKVHFTSKGTFTNLIQLTNDSFDLNAIVLLKELFSLLPELRELFFIIYSEEPNVFLLQEKIDDAGMFKVIFQADNIGRVITKDFSMMTANGYHLNINQNPYICTGVLLLSDDSWGNDNNVIYLDALGNKYCTTGININGGLVKISKISILYICYYVLSMLVRYYPDVWMSFCDSKDITLISKLMTSIKNISLIEILQLLNNETYVFTSKIPSLDKDLNYSDILKNLLKEIEQENKRLGKSILTDYL